MSRTEITANIVDNVLNGQNDSPLADLSANLILARDSFLVISLMDSRLVSAIGCARLLRHDRDAVGSAASAWTSSMSLLIWTPVLALRLFS